jgi:hypothetical protein
MDGLLVSVSLSICKRLRGQTTKSIHMPPEACPGDFRCRWIFLDDNLVILSIFLWNAGAISDAASLD